MLFVFIVLIYHNSLVFLILSKHFLSYNLERKQHVFINLILFPVQRLQHSSYACPMEDDLSILISVKESFQSRWREIQSGLQSMRLQIETRSNLSSNWFNERNMLSNTLSCVKENLNDFALMPLSSKASNTAELKRIEVCSRHARHNFNSR